MDAIEELRYLVLAAQRDGSRAFAAALKPLGVTPAQSEVLTILRAAPDQLSVRELGELLVCETGSPSRLVRSLVEAGLVAASTSQHDARRTSIQLTETGVKTADAVAQVERVFHQRLRQALPPEDLGAVVELLRGFVGDGPAGQALERRRRTVRPSA